MIWVWVVVCVLVVGAAAVVVAGRDHEMAEVYDDRPDVPIPTGRALTATDLDELRFSTGLRGYRMDEVDAFVARVRAELLTHPLEERQHDDDDRYGDAADPPEEQAEPDGQAERVEPDHEPQHRSGA